MLAGADYPDILKQQYYLASKAGISITESNMMCDFEREYFVSQLLKEMKEKQDSLDNLNI